MPQAEFSAIGAATRDGIGTLAIGLLEIDEIAAAIDAAESRVRGAVPSARMIYLEQDLYRADHT